MASNRTNSTLLRLSLVLAAGAFVAACGDDDTTDPVADTGADAGDVMEGDVMDDTMGDTMGGDVMDDTMEGDATDDTTEGDATEDVADTTEGPGTIPEVAIAAGNFSTLVDAVVTAGLDDDLSGEGPFTVFAPTDAAFAALPEGTLEGLSVEELTDILLYHVVADELLADDVLGASLLPSLLGTFIKIDGAAGTAGGAPIATTNIEASNGVIHVIDAVMLPPGDIPTVATESGLFPTLVSALTDLDLVEALQSEGPFTVFAPTEDAFAALPDGTLESLSADELEHILLFHVVAGAYSAADVLAETSLDMLNDRSAAIASGDDGPTIAGAGIVDTDIPASNGIIHVIDAVMIPGPGTIPQEAEANGNFTTLVDAVVTAGLDDDLSGEGPFTVFAPTDAAFDALPDGTLEGLSVEELTNILLYHVVADELFADDVLGASLLPSLLGTFIKIDGEAGTAAGAPISMTNVEASNGVIHVIDAVMLPPGDIPTVANDSGLFPTLVGALVDLELDDALAAEGPFTVFAPTEDAFAALPDGTLESLSAEELTDILLYHVVSGAYTAADVVAETSLTMLNDDVAAIAVDEDGATIAGANIVDTDIPASNGVIHVIDAVILPPSE